MIIPFLTNEIVDTVGFKFVSPLSSMLIHQSNHYFGNAMIQLVLMIVYVNKD
jgi:hypothetical protein